MPTLSAQELSQQDPKRFQQEYSKWTEYALDYDWWDYAEEQLKERLALAGVAVEGIEFSLSYSQGDYATFKGRINLGMWMEVTKDGEQTYAEKYPALFLAAQDYGDWASVNTWNRRYHASVTYDAHLVGNTGPEGVFSGLDQEAWDELVEEQLDAAGLEKALQDYVDDISRQLYRDLRDEYEHLTSEQSFIESCECNDVTFEIEEECEA
jgi:hypothetical protein